MVWPLCVQCNVGVGSRTTKLKVSITRPRRIFNNTSCQACCCRAFSGTNACEDRPRETGRCPLRSVQTGKAPCEHMFSGLPPKDGVIGRPSLWIAEDFWVLRFRLMVKRGPWLRPQASEGEAQHGPFCWIGRIGQGNEHLHCG